MRLPREHGFESLAFPLVEVGTGGGTADAVPAIVEDELPSCDFEGTVRTGAVPGGQQRAMHADFCRVCRWPGSLCWVCCGAWAC